MKKVSLLILYNTPNRGSDNCRVYIYIAITEYSIIKICIYASY